MQRDAEQLQQALFLQQQQQLQWQLVALAKFKLSGVTTRLGYVCLACACWHAWGAGSSARGAAIVLSSLYLRQQQHLELRYSVGANLPYTPSSRTAVAPPTLEGRVTLNGLLLQKKWQVQNPKANPPYAARHGCWLDTKYQLLNHTGGKKPAWAKAGRGGGRSRSDPVRVFFSLCTDVRICTFAQPHTKGRKKMLIWE